MSDAMAIFVAKLVASAMLTLVIIVGVAAFGHSILWWIAALIALAVVFGGMLIIEGDWID